MFNDMIKRNPFADYELDEDMFCSENKSKYEIVGTLKIKEITEFNSEFPMIISEPDGNTHTVIVDPEEHEEFMYALHSDETYKIVCEKRNGKTYVDLFQKDLSRIQSIKETAAKEENIFKIRRFSKDGSFTIKSKGLLIELPNVSGNVFNIEEFNNSTKFSLKVADGKILECFIINSLNLPNVPLELSENTTYSFRGYISGEDGYFYITGSDKTYKEKEIYSHIPSELRHIFRNLSPLQKKEILNLFQFYTSENIDVLPPIAFSTDQEYELKYKLIKQFLPKTIVDALEKLTRDKSLKDNHRLLIYRTILDKTYKRTTPQIDIEKCKADIAKTYFGREREIDKLINLLMRPEGCIICVVGPSGSGRHTLIKTVTSCASVKVNELTLSGVNTSAIILGSGREYDNASIGKFYRCVQSQEVMLLKNADMMSENSDDPFFALVDILDSGILTDKLIETPIDLMSMGVKIILTVSDTSKFPEAILNKLNIIYLSDYTPEEKKEICKNYIVPKGLEMASLKDISFDDDAYDVIANQFSLGTGLFDAVSNVKTILEKVKHSANHITHISANDIAPLLGIRLWSKKDIPHDIQGLKEKFCYYKPLYEEVRAKRILELFNLFNKENSTENKNRILAELHPLVNILKGEAFSELDIHKLSEDLNRSHYNMTEVKKTFLNNATLRKHSEKRIKPILLAGPYGSGKTTITEAFAKAMNCPYVFIQCQDAKSNLTIKIKSQLAQCGSSRVILFLDEIDKMDKYMSPVHSLQGLIDGNLLAEDTQCPINVEDITIVATCNDIGSIPGALLSRFDIVYIDGYSADEKKSIAKKFMIPKLLNTFNADNILFTEEIINELLKYSPELGMRDFEKNLTNVIAYILRTKETISEYKVTTEDIMLALGAKPIKPGNFPEYLSEDDVPPGVVKGLALCGNQGITTAITVSPNEFSETDTIVGLLGESTLESVTIARHVCQNILGKKIPPSFISFSEGSIKKNGASGGLAVFIAFMSSALGQSVNSSYAFTGEINQHGYIFAVGVKEKIKGAISDECTKKVFIPHSNYIQELEEGNLEKYSNIELVPVKHVNDIIYELFTI